jgi:hypothetical protein
VQEVVMTKEKELAQSERAEFDAASHEDKKKCKRHGIGDFINMKHPGISQQSVKNRARLLLAGDRAETLWQRIDKEGMPLRTAVRLLIDAEHAWAEDGRKAPVTGYIEARLIRYDSEGTVRVLADGKTYRSMGPKERAAKIARGAGEEALPLREQGRSRAGGSGGGGGVGVGGGGGGAPQTRFGEQRAAKTAVRAAIAAWIATRIPEDDDRAEEWTDDCLRDVESLLDSFSKRFEWPAPRKARLMRSCDLLNVPRPRWGKPVDQQRAWKHQKASLRATHPDVLGHEGGREAFQAFKDAYQDIVAYNDSLRAKGVGIEFGVGADEANGVTPVNGAAAGDEVRVGESANDESEGESNA